MQKNLETYHHHTHNCIQIETIIACMQTQIILQEQSKARARARRWVIYGRLLGEEVQWSWRLRTATWRDSMIYQTIPGVQSEEEGKFEETTKIVFTMYSCVPQGTSDGQCDSRHEFPGPILY